jgi:ABC-2 type transport system permease protein
VTDQGIVYDLGYKPHDGPRLGRSGAVRATIRDGLRRQFGIRRKARKKILPWMLFILAMLPAIVFVGFVFLTSQIAVDELLDTPFADHVAYFDVSAGLVLLFCALSGPELLVPDRVDGVLSVYSSRPMTIFDYLGARAGALAIGVAMFMLVPQLVLYFGFAALRDGGFVSNLITNAEDLFQIVTATVVYLMAYGAPAFLVAVFARRLAPATGLYLGGMLALNGVATGFTEAGSKWAALLAISDHPSVVRDWIFDRSTDLVPVRAGLDAWMSLAVIVVITVVTLVIAVRRYRSLL